MKLLAALSFGLLALVTFAVKAEIPLKHPFPDTVTVETAVLKLNGKGIRKATLLGVKVYEAALYLKTPSSDADAILASDDPKVVELMYLRDLNKRDSEKAWAAAFQANCAPDCAALAEGFEAFKKLLRDSKPDDVYRYVFTKDGVEAWFKDEKLGKVDGAPLARALLATWIGKRPPNMSFKKTLLGK